MTSASVRRPCILLVDDTPANIQILVGLLQADYDLKVATRGAQALQICEKNPQIDLILLDVMMPEMDGYEVCRQLRANESTREMPVIFLTAKTEVDDVVRGFELGASDYVTKPFQPPELSARVRTHLLVRRQQREIAEKNAELKEVLQIVSHDVANHFAVVSMSIELLQANPSFPLDKILPRIAAAGRNGTALTTLVRDLRRAEDKGLLVQAVSLRAAIDETLLLAETRLHDKQLTVNRDIPDLQVIAELTAFTNSVLGNILSNAIKFSHPGSAVDIVATVEDGMACIRLRDHGVGMPPEVLNRVFDVSKSHSRKGTAGESGTGFGMPVMRKFVTLFGGTVAVTSREKATHPDDHGTEFAIRLKLAP
ncbi:MAG TPA: hybrid sensor histidine kinase/response regulator [Opitutaceae bacterium]|nr:hybrid sensor histidine kinase/response regulator [Lacunisphaera sp.]HWA09102.1 hybrid sensor histidine kinase/response regulator [Opitutaceae bacterium]